VPRAHDVGRCGFYLKVDRAVISLLSKAGWTWGCVSGWIFAGERSLLLTHIAATESVSLCMRMKS